MAGLRRYANYFREDVSSLHDETAVTSLTNHLNAFLTNSDSMKTADYTVKTTQRETIRPQPKPRFKSTRVNLKLERKEPNIPEPSYGLT